MNLAKAFARQSPRSIAVEMAALLLVIGELDLITSYQFRLLPFYAVPIFAVAWFCGKRPGLLTALASGVIWWCANWFGGDPDLRTWIAIWETGRHFGFFLVVALAASALRTKSDMAAARIALLEHSQRLERVSSDRATSSIFGTTANARRVPVSCSQSTQAARLP